MKKLLMITSIALCIPGCGGNQKRAQAIHKTRTLHEEIAFEYRQELRTLHSGMNQRELRMTLQEIVMVKHDRTRKNRLFFSNSPFIEYKNGLEKAIEQLHAQREALYAFYNGTVKRSLYILDQLIDDLEAINTHITVSRHYQSERHYEQTALTCFQEDEPMEDDESENNGSVSDILAT